MARTVSLLFVLSALLMGGSYLVAQPREATGLFGNYTLIRHSADFRSFEDTPSCCPKFESGSGTGIAFGFLYEVPFSTSFRAAFRAGYLPSGGTLLRSEATVVSGGVAGRFDHRVDVQRATIGIEPLLQIGTVGNLWLNLGFRAAFVSSKTFSQKEVISEPSFGTFPNGQRSRNEVTDRDIPRAAEFAFGALGGISYDLPMNTDATLILAPEILYTLPLTLNVNGTVWTTSNLRFGLAVKFSPLPPVEQVIKRDTVYTIDTVRQTVVARNAGYVRGAEQRSKRVISTEELYHATLIIRRTDTVRIAEASVLRASIRVETGMTAGLQSPLMVEEFKSVLMSPLLNYVFFDENSSEIPQRYRLLRAGETATFAVADVNSPDRLSTYYHVLNIVGKRMKETPKAMLTLIGCNAGSGQEKNNIALSKSRAESVKAYLTSVWKIEPSRITVESRNTPEKAANPLMPDGAEENRRVEIVSSVASIIAPVVTNDTLLIATPATLLLRPAVTHTNAIMEWTVTAAQGNDILYTQQGTSIPPDTLAWDIGNTSSKKPQSTEPLRISFTVRDGAGATESSSVQLAVTQRSLQSKREDHSADKQINRFSLILFNVRSTEVSPSNKIIAGFIKSYLSPASTVTITGYTDRLGDTKQNQTLAEERARATARELGIPEQSDRVLGIGNAATYNPMYPEGRLYTRTVDIIIETPVTN
ncbi:MAG: OmpA family protein [Candidatus Kapabacteria bacterium]|nr:OmpA family protein [Candidatus Kapabacteria bacterium]